MAYIGNAKTPLIFASNTRDDIVPVQKQGGSYETKFTLSQEVPGGYENNVMVVRRRFITETKTPNSSSVVITKVQHPQDGYICKLITSDETLTTILNDIVPVTSNYEGDCVTIFSSVSSYNNGKTVKVLEKAFDGTELTLTLDISDVDLDAQTGGQTAVSRCYYGAWEILEAEKDYSIESGNGLENVNKVISFAVAPQKYDIAYVLHRGDATYNFVPSANSVGPDQLSHNLRTFVCDRHRATANQDTFELSQDVVSSKAILVFVDDVFTDGDDLPNLFTEGTWTLSTDGKEIVFKTPLTLGQRVRILHLGFSTVSRRYGFFPGQEGASLADRSVTTNKISIGAVTNNRIANGAVTIEKLADDSVDGSKLLINNNQALRVKNTSGTPDRILELSGNNTKLNSPGTELKLSVGQTTLLNSFDGSCTWATSTENAKLAVTNTSGSANAVSKMLVEVTSTKGVTIQATNTSSEIDSRELPLKIKNSSGSLTLNTSGNVGVATDAPTEKLEVVGNIKSSQSVIAQNVQTQTINGLPIGQVGVPTGTIVMSAVSLPPEGWELCRGQICDGTTTKYSTLYAAIGNTFGGTGTNFAIPDLQHRMPVGSSPTRGMSGASANEGILSHENRSLSHRHVGGSHTHNIAHTHELPAHTHAVSANSSISITGGVHQTDLYHEHVGFYTEVDGLHTHPVDAKNLSGYANSTAKTIEIDLRHNHRSWPASIWNGTTAGGHNPYSLSSEIVGDLDQMPLRNISIASGGGHEHPINAMKGCTVAVSSSTHKGALDTGNSYEIAVGEGGRNQDVFSGFAVNPPTPHSHLDSEFATGISHWYTDNAFGKSSYSLIGNVGSDADTKHQHKIPTLNLPKNSNNISPSSSTGSHTHNSSEFSGSVGTKLLFKKLAAAINQNSKTILLNETTNVLVGQLVINPIFPGGSTKIVSVSSGSIVVDAFPTNNFGSIGTDLQISSQDGDTILSTQSQSTPNSGTSSTHETELATLPHIVLNFIIKL